jgi:hypothetical protein
LHEIKILGFSLPFTKGGLQRRKRGAAGERKIKGGGEGRI